MKTGKIQITERMYIHLNYETINLIVKTSKFLGILKK